MNRCDDNNHEMFYHSFTEKNGLDILEEICFTDVLVVVSKPGKNNHFSLNEDPLSILISG